MVVLGLDPGQVALGFCVIKFTGQRRQFVGAGELKDVTAPSLVTWLNSLLNDCWPAVVGVEDYGWYGPERSANPNAFALSQLVGAIEGAALMWSRLSTDGVTDVLRVRKVDANRAVGISGKAPKSRVKATIEALFPGAKLSNEHQRDAAVVCMAARVRAGR